MFKTILIPLIGLCLALGACENCYTCDCQRQTIVEDIDADDGIDVTASDETEDYEILDVCGRGADLEAQVADHEEMKTDVDESNGGRTTIHDQCSCDESM